MVQCVTSVDCDADLVESEHVLYIYIYVCVCELAGIGGCNLLHPIMYPYCHPTLPPPPHPRIQLSPWVPHEGCTTIIAELGLLVP